MLIFAIFRLVGFTMGSGGMTVHGKMSDPRAQSVLPSRGLTVLLNSQSPWSFCDVVGNANCELRISSCDQRRAWAGHTVF
jgi:hypothetical protein